MFLDNTFFLMNKDQKLLTFQVHRSELGTLKFEEISREGGTLLPIGFSDIQSWIAHRQAPKHRAHIEKLLRMCGCYDLEGYIRVTYALNLNDTFWICPATSDLTWERVSLFQNDFDETIARLAFEGGLYGESFSNTSPEFGTSGSFAKCWIREKGEIYLMKQGSEGARNSGSSGANREAISKCATRPGRRGDSRACHMVFRRFFCKIFQGCQGTFAGLDLVEDQQSLPGDDFFRKVFLKKMQNTLRREISAKKFSDNRHSLKIHIDGISKIVSAKMSERICFSDQAGAIEQEREPVFSCFFPFDKFSGNHSFHKKPPT